MHNSLRRFRALALLVALPLMAQTKPAARTPEQLEASYQAHKGDFDYLLGDWEFTAESKDWGRFNGRWSAVKLSEGQILDEFRAFGGKDDPDHVTTTLRNYNRFREEWELMGTVAGSGLHDFGSGTRTGDEMRIEQTTGIAAGRPTLWRIRYYGIRADRFSWTCDISRDGGKTWISKNLVIEAKRIGPARSMGSLTPKRDQ